MNERVSHSECPLGKVSHAAVWVVLRLYIGSHPRTFRKEDGVWGEQNDYERGALKPEASHSQTNQKTLLQWGQYWAWCIFMYFNFFQLYICMVYIYIPIHP